MYGTCAILKLIGRARGSQVRAGKTVKYDAALNGRGQLITAANALLMNAVLDHAPEWVSDLWLANAMKSQKERLVLAASLIVAEVERLNYIESTPALDVEKDRWELLNLRKLPRETLREAADRIYGG